ncbi:hypothetical protein POTOM_030969 [Populus tomentosa]|uniref:Uncharacterized protein n=1 Tax=Populus tomentosa TaxID=118781 RepID=A0A8X7Z6Z2_POPTO|nr:hypothetical protein POTOM_030969 [Populus tomentosa]
MHLWPTMRIRESFKISYLKKYDWNLQRMNSEKKRQSQEANDNSNQQRLLDDAGENSRNEQKPANNSKAVLICREILMVITCCYCCSCFGVVDNKMQYTGLRGTTEKASGFKSDDPIKPVLIKTRNDAVLEGVRPLNLLFEDNISEGGTGIVQFSCECFASVTGLYS